MPRPLLVTADPDVLDDLLRLAATAGVEVEVAADAVTARRAWATAPLVVVGADLVDRCAAAGLGRRPRLAVLGGDLDDASIWQRAVEVGAEQVVFLPDGEPWLVTALAEAVEGAVREGLLVAVLGGRGGAGATTLSCALAVTAARRGAGVLLVDGDPLGGGVDLVFGGEQAQGLRWPELSTTKGRLSAQALTAALPRFADVAVLSWDRGQPTPLPADAVRAVVSAGRRTHELVVFDLPRWPDDAAGEVLAAATTAFLVVPSEVRAAAAAARVAARAGLLCRDLRVVVRGPSPVGLAPAEVARALGLPLAGAVRPEPGLDAALERGEVPASRGRSPLAALCGALLDALPGEGLRAAA